MSVPPDTPGAPCLERGPDLWFGSNRHQTAEAKRICVDDCPWLLPCREHGVRRENHGIWGGWDQDERNAERKRRGIAPPSERDPDRNGGGLPHGTARRYMAGCDCTTCHRAWLDERQQTHA